MKELLVLIFCGALCLSARAEQVVADNFDIKGGRSASAKLNGQPTSEGGGQWSTYGNFYLTETGAVSLPTGGGSAVVDLSAGGRIWTVEADIKPRGKEWIGIALGGDKLGTSWLDPEAGALVQVYLRAQGNGAVYVQGAKTPLLKNRERRVPNFDENGFNHVKLTYNLDRNSVTVEVNGEPILESYSLEKLGLTLDIKKAGFHFHPSTDGLAGEVDNFKVTQN